MSDALITGCPRARGRWVDLVGEFQGPLGCPRARGRWAAFKGKLFAFERVPACAREMGIRLQER